MEFLGETAGLVYFISMAHSERYGADHPLAKAARVLKHKLRISLAPLLNFADADVGDAAEEALLDRLWQDGGPVAESARAVAEAIESTEELQEMTAAFPELVDRLRELADMASWAAEQDANVRLTYAL
jgi:hypothetical protein